MNNKVTLFFLAEITRWFAREIRNVIELVGLFIGIQIINPFSIAQAILKDNQVVRPFIEKFSEVLEYCDGL